MKRLGWLLFVLALVYFIFLIRQDIIDYLDLKKTKDKVVTAVERESKMAGNLQDKLSNLKSDDRIEELARTQLGMIKRGETAYKVIN